MAAQHGISSTTYESFVIDSGAIYLNYGEVGQTLLGATRGGCTCSVEQEIREMEVDGAHGPVVGSERIIRRAPKIVANFIELSTTLFTHALPGSASNVVGSHDRVTRIRNILTTDYLTNIAVVGETTKSTSVYIEFVILSALATENLEMSLADKDESVLTLTYMGHFQPTDLVTEPFRINWPS